ncbi:MAG: hypothetical protein L0228_07585 [Planctomycetes bacterium]|nr:hypothetical protein [Planctomycetota bacterium]
MKASFPLASLALLITVFACLLVCADVERWREQYTWLAVDWPWRLVALFGGAALFGGLIGVGFMFASKLRWRARLLAPVAGILAGQVGVLLLVAPGPIWRTIFAVLVLLGTAILFRLGAE